MSELQPIYYMRDNHTFKKLSEDIEIAIEEISDEIEAGYSYGMLCSKIPNFKIVHSHGDSFKEVRKFLKECREVLTVHKI